MIMLSQAVNKVAEIDVTALVSQYGKYGILAVAVLILMGSKIPWSSMVAKAKGVIGNVKVPSIGKKKVTPSSDSYLEAVSLWYQLREQCETCHLHDAREKLKEVFPLLCESMKECDKHSVTAPDLPNKFVDGGMMLLQGDVLTHQNNPVGVVLKNNGSGVVTERS